MVESTSLSSTWKAPILCITPIALGIASFVQSQQVAGLGKVLLSLSGGYNLAMGSLLALAGIPALRSSVAPLIRSVPLGMGLWISTMVSVATLLAMILTGGLAFFNVLSAAILLSQLGSYLLTMFRDTESSRHAQIAHMILSSALILTSILR